MPLHDWSTRKDWANFHFHWLGRLFDWIQPRLPEGFRAYVGHAPRLAIGGPTMNLDISVRDANLGERPPRPPLGEDRRGAERLAPDLETTTMVIETDEMILIEWGGRIVSAVELVSPRNKDRPDSREHYQSRSLQYLLDGINLLLIDVLSRPSRFSFADRLDEALEVEPSVAMPPLAASYRVGEPAPDEGRYLALWRRVLTVGAALPTIALPLSIDLEIEVDLEATYRDASGRAYLD